MLSRKVAVAFVVLMTVLAPALTTSAQPRDGEIQLPPAPIDQRTRTGERPEIAPQRADLDFNWGGFSGVTRPALKADGDVIGRARLEVNRRAVNEGNYVIIYACQDVRRDFDFCFNGSLLDGPAVGVRPPTVWYGVPQGYCRNIQGENEFYSAIEGFTARGEEGDLAESQQDDDNRFRRECRQED